MCIRDRWPDERAAAGGRPGGEQGPPRAGQLSGVREGQRPERGGQRGDLRGQTDLGVHRRTPDPDRDGRGKGGLVSALQAEFTAEVTRLAELTAGSLSTDGGQRGQGLAAVELAIRTAMSKLGASLLADLLGLDSGHRGPRIDCGAGHQANFISYRDKNLDTVLGPVTLGRAYYHCTDCAHGMVPKDDELGVVGASLSPGLRAMVARVGTATPFAKASELLATLAGVQLTTKRVERSAEADGQALVAIGDAGAAAVLSGQLTPIGPAT